MRWMVPVNSLDVQQRQILDTITRGSTPPHWISGYAGTGKTILITHAIERIAARELKAGICFVTYTHALKDLVESGLSEKIKSRIEIRTIDTLKNEQDNYDYIFIDEIQDIKENLILNIQRRAGQVIAAGDPEQSIYDQVVDPKLIQKLLGGAQKHELKEVHRLPESVFTLAKVILPEARIVQGVKAASRGPKIRTIKATSFNLECMQVFKEASRLAEPGIPSAVLFPTHEKLHSFASVVSKEYNWGEPPKCEMRGPIKDYEQFNYHFSKGNRSPLQFLGSNNGDLPESDGRKIVYLMTYHSAKGLDFASVFLPGIDSNFDIGGLDALKHTERYKLKMRRLLFVAITRTRERLYISHHGDVHPLFKNISASIAESFQGI